MFENTAGHSLDFRLMNEFQKSFPLCPAPFAELAAKLGVAESVVLDMLEKLRREGKISRVGAVFSPKRIGASTLVAMAVPSDKLGVIADAVNRFPEVNQNYEREHYFNLWFVLTAGSEGRLQAALGAIEKMTGFPVISLPLLREFPADSDISEGKDEKEVSHPAHAQPFSPPSVLDEIERRLVMALQEGLPLFIRPFSVLASRVGCDESEVLERIRRWCADGVIKRFGVVPRHHDSDSGTHALLVHDIPDEDVVRMGEALAAEPGVALCHERPRVLPEWTYNLYCMVHGQTRENVQARIAELRQRLNLVVCAHDILFSLTRRQTVSGQD